MACIYNQMANAKYINQELRILVVMKMVSVCDEDPDPSDTCASYESEDYDM